MQMAATWLLQAARIKQTTVATGVLLANGLATAVVYGLILWGCITFLRRESFAYTHYPLRFNRKNRMAYVWRTNGTVLEVPWDDVFFTLAKVLLLVSLFRVFAMRTSKIPRWPDHVETACAVEAGDPYAIAGDADGNRIAVYPEAADAAGVRFPGSGSSRA